MEKRFLNWLLDNESKLMTFNKKYLIEAVFHSCKNKAIIVRKDEKEKNIRAILNLGHTFGHAIEAINNYQKALELYPEIEPLINEKIESAIDMMMEDAYSSFQKNNMQMVLNLLHYLIEIQPQREKELDPYIVKIKKIIKDNEGTFNINFNCQIFK